MSEATISQMLSLTIDGETVAVPAGTTLYDAALQAGTELPVLCHDPKFNPVAVCRMCVVEVGRRNCHPGQKDRGKQEPKTE